jgi:hypothetical protein
VRFDRCGCSRFSTGQDLDILETATPGQQGQVRDAGRVDIGAQGSFGEQSMRGTWLAAESGRCITLGIQVNQQGLVSGHGQTCCEINGSRGFSHATFLVCNTKNVRHAILTKNGAKMQ